MFDARRKGDLLKTFTASARGLTVSHTTKVQVVEEIGHPQFPLRVGNTWVYAPFSSAGASNRVFFSGGSRSHATYPEKAFRITITGTEEKRGSRTFVVERSGTAPATWGVMAADGELLTDTGEGFMAGAPAAGASAGTFGCTFLPLDGHGGCHCPNQPGGLLSVPPGPKRCSISRGGGLKEGLLRGIFTVITVGIATPGSSRSSKGVELINFVQGPNDAEHVEPSWNPTPNRHVDAALVALQQAPFLDEKQRELKRALAGAAALDCTAAETILNNEAFFHQDKLFLTLAPFLIDPEGCTDLISEILRHNPDLLERLRNPN